MSAPDRRTIAGPLDLAGSPGPIAVVPVTDPTGGHATSVAVTTARAATGHQAIALSAIDRAVTARATTVRPAIGRATAARETKGRVTTDRAPTGPATKGRVTTDRAPTGRARTVRVVIAHAATGRAKIVDGATGPLKGVRATIGRATKGRVTIDHAPTGSAMKGRVTIERAPTGRAKIVRVVIGRRARSPGSQDPIAAGVQATVPTRHRARATTRRARITADNGRGPSPVRAGPPGRVTALAATGAHLTIAVEICETIVAATSTAGNQNPIALRHTVTGPGPRNRTGAAPSRGPAGVHATSSAQVAIAPAANLQASTSLRPHATTALSVRSVAAREARDW